MNPSLNQDHRSILINIHKIYFADGFVLSSGVIQRCYAANGGIYNLHAALRQPCYFSSLP